MAIFDNREDNNIKDGLENQITHGDTVMPIPSTEDISLPELTHAELTRYSRHLILPEVGIKGQKKLKSSKVLLVGAGGLGAPIALYLAAAGVGTIGLVDFDIVEETNLQRQIIHGTGDIGRPKIDSAKDRIKAINPNVNVITFETRLNSENALDIMKDFDVVADGTDNFPTRYLINDACVILKKPNVYGSVFRFEGQSSVFFYAENGPCYRCLYPEPPPPGLVPSCNEGGILGVLPGIIGCIQANETIKLLIGGGEPLISRLLIFDAWKMNFRELKLRKDPNCPICGKNPTITQLIDYEEFCGLKKNTKPIEEITATELKKLLANDPSIQIIDIREPYELSIGKLANSKFIPFEHVVKSMPELDPTKTTVFVCKLGTRSAIAIGALTDAGYKGRLLNLQGGINACLNTNNAL